MHPSTLATLLVFFALLPLGFSGCDSSSPETDSGSNATNNESGDSGPAAESAGADDSEELSRAQEGLAKLAPEDAASAQQQRTCPVSGELLGTMGAPKKVDVDGQPVWVCCEACTDSLQKNPDKYLDKLKD